MIPFYDVQDSDKTNTQTTLYSLLSTVTDNKSYYMCADIEGADRARIYQGLLGWPETSVFKTYVNNNLLLNCSITMEDINRADHIYG